MITNTDSSKQQWQAYCRYSGGTWYLSGWYDAIDRDHAIKLATDKRIRSRTVDSFSSWEEENIGG